jgi:large subunit ribosomal protein L4
MLTEGRMVEIMKVDVLNMQNQVVSQVELPEEVFGVEPKEHVVHQVVRMQLANRRAGTASTKNRALVSGSRRKPWRQKGTGRARAGSRQSPIWRGGGVVFGPHPRDYSIKVNKKVRRAALRMVLSDKLREGKLKILEEIQLTSISTKSMVEVLNNLGVDSVLIVTAQRDEVIEKSARNIPRVKVLPVVGLNVYDILLYDYLILSRDSLELIERRAGA